MPNQDIQGRTWNILNLDDDYETDDEIDEIDVETTNTAYSVSLFLPARHTYAWGVQFSSDGAIDVKVELEQQLSNDGDWAVPDNKVDFPMFTITDSDFHIVAYAPVATLNGRLKLTGQGSNDATTKLIVAKMYTAGN